MILSSIRAGTSLSIIIDDITNGNLCKSQKYWFLSKFIIVYHRQTFLFYYYFQKISSMILSKALQVAWIVSVTSPPPRLPGPITWQSISKSIRPILLLTIHLADVGSCWGDGSLHPMCLWRDNPPWSELRCHICCKPSLSLIASSKFAPSKEIFWMDLFIID